MLAQSYLHLLLMVTHIFIIVTDYLREWDLQHAYHCFHNIANQKIVQAYSQEIA